MATSYYLLLLASAAYAALPLPQYIKPCYKDSPDFNDCALQHGREAIPHIVKGDRKYKIPRLDPIHITQIKVSQGPRQAGFTLDMQNITMTGLKETSLESIRFDIEKQHFKDTFNIPRLEIVGQYEISGRILVLPISGRGDINITLVNSTVNFDQDYVVTDNHLVATKTKCDIVPTRAYMHLTNLFGGDRLLGKQMNNFINENWRDVYQEMSPTVAEAFTQVAVTILNNIAEAVSYDLIFPDSPPPQ